MLRLLLTRRWLSLLGLVVILVPVFVRLGFWQLDRLDQRRAKNAVITKNLGAAPEPVDSLVGTDRAVAASDEWRQVTAQGRYDPAHELLVRNRTSTENGAPGFHVLTPLVTESGTALLVNRGWIPFGETARATPVAPAPPAGIVTVVGRLRPPERQVAHGPRDGPDVPVGQVVRIDVPRIAATVPYPLYDGYVELVSEEPTANPAPTLLDAPSVGEGPHLAYAVQWFLFACIAIGGFWYLLIREAREERAKRLSPGPTMPAQVSASSRPSPD